MHTIIHGWSPDMFWLAAILPFHKKLDFQGGLKDCFIESFSGHSVTIIRLCLTIEDDSYNLERLTQKSKQSRKKRSCNREGQWEKDKSPRVQHLPHQRQAIACQSAICKLWARSKETPNWERESNAQRETGAALTEVTRLSQQIPRPHASFLTLLKMQLLNSFNFQLSLALAD